jgi:hypothetical protein
VGYAQGLKDGDPCDNICSNTKFVIYINIYIYVFYCSHYASDPQNGNGVCVLIPDCWERKPVDPSIYVTAYKPDCVETEAEQESEKISVKILKLVTYLIIIEINKKKFFFLFFFCYLCL